MENLSNIIGGLSYVGCVWEQHNGNRLGMEFHLGRSDVASGTR